MTAVLDRPNVVLEEERIWDDAVEALLGPGARLVAVSRWIADSRVYALRDRAAVIRSLHRANDEGLNSLRVAEEAMRRIGRRARYVKAPPWEVLHMPRVEGASLESVLDTLTLRQRLRVLRCLATDVRALHAVGVAHRDLRPDNVLVAASGRVSLVDFDRAVFADRRTVALADWLGLSRLGLSPNPYLKLAAFTLAPRLRSFLRRARSRYFEQSSREPPHDPDLHLLWRAWELARRSSANAPGQDLAYYALSYRHWHFPGERPWHLRWDAIRQTVPLAGRRVVDLGTNMGLLPAFALVHGAESATGIDRDPQILEAARLVARALAVEPDLICADLANGSDWESAVRHADVVFAMSLLRWLPENRRVLDFLESSTELVYEGHDDLAVEVARLRKCGFVEMDVLLVTERGRALIWCRKR